MKKDILIGTLLGDASISKLYGRRKSYSIRWEHSKKQKEYAKWKAENSLDNYSIYERSRVDRRTGNTYDSITFYSTKDDYKDYRELFYKDSKQVSDKILAELTELSIAVWFMDDGNLYYNGNNCHLTLSVNGFDKDSKERIINFFKDKYDINFKISQKAIRLTSIREVNKFEKHFSKFYHKSMEYKKLANQKKKYKNEKK